MELHKVTYGFDEPDAARRPALVFLNGMTQSTAHWKSQARAMSDAFRVITYDARGQGDTPAGPEPLTLPLHAADLAELLGGLGIDGAHLVGFSHGARVALQFAASYPERVRKLVLVSATARPSALARMIVRSWREVLARGGLEGLAWASLPMILGESYLQASERMVSGIVKASVDRNSEEGVRRLLDAMIDYPDLSDLARSVQSVTLVLTAAQDLLVTREGAQELAALCGGEHVEVHDSGHTIPIEQPDEFRRIVRRFLVSS